MSERPDSAALFRLLSWLSPSFPVGAYSYSHGLEWLVETGVVRDEASLRAWLRDVLALGGGRCDAILFCAAYRAAARKDLQCLAEIAELSVAFNPSAERELETTAQGDAFAVTIRAIWRSPSLDALSETYGGSIAYPVAVAAVAADHDIPPEPALLAYLHAFAANLISAGVRLIPLGQSSGQRVTVGIEKTLSDVAEEARSASLADLGGSLMLGDMASMFHETQHTRLFRS